MQRYLDDDDVVKSIVKNVIRECRKNGIEATEECVSFLIRLVILDPTKGFLNLSIDECIYAVDEIVELCIKKLSRELSPALLTIKIQSYFIEQFTSKDKVIFDHRLAITKLTEPLMRELMEKDVKEKNAQDVLYHKLAVAVTLLSGLGNPTNRAVLCATTVALSSIFPVNELPRFLALGKYDKERQIEELTHIVAGIRIFNYDTHKHVEGIVDLPNILKEACIASKESLENEKTSVNNTINMLSQLLNECYVEQPSDFDPDLIDIIPSYPLRMNPDDVEFFKDLLVAKQQMKIYLRLLLHRVEKCENEVDNNCEMLKENLLELEESVRYRTAVLTSYIYPKFIQVSIIWNTLQDQMVLLTSYNELLERLKDFFNAFDHKTSVLEAIVESIHARKRRRKEMGDETSEEVTEDIRIDSSKINNCEIIYPQEGEEESIEDLQFLGCCTLRLAKGNGLLLPGNPKIGFLSFGLLNYSFATCASAYTFDRNPEMYLKEIFRLIRKMPELIDVLNMNNAVERYMQLKEIQKQTDEEIGLINSETQTVVHPVGSFIDPEYSWDIWELKRRAVELANISKKKTHSTQTVRSHMRANVGTQTYSAKEVSTQTKKDNKSTMPKLSTFIFGLRGRNVKLAHTAILTRPHDEWLYEPGARVLNNIYSARKFK